MITGTITLTNSSTSITGSGTAFISELKAGDFIFTTVNGINYTLGVDSVSSDTELTLIVAFNGATTSGLSFEVITRQAMVGITAQLAADTARAIRGLNYDKQNWQQILSGTGTVTVTLPDGSQYSGPAWPDITSSLSSINTSLSKKADSSDLAAYSKTADLDAYAKTADLDVYAKTASLGGAASLDVGTTSGTVAAGDDSRLGTIDGKTGGNVSGDVSVYGTTWTYGNSCVARSVANSDGSWPTTSPAFSALLTNRVASDGQPGGWFGGNITENVGVDCYGSLYLNAAGVTRNWLFNQAGNALAANGSWINNSDKRIKTNITKISKPLEKMAMLRGVTWDRLDGSISGQGFIAQSVQKVMPTAVFVGSDTILSDGTVVPDTLAVDVAGVSSSLHHESILALMSIMKQGLTIIAGQTSDATTKSSLTELAALIPDESTYATQ